MDEPYKWLSLREEKQINAIRNSKDRHVKFEELIGKKILRGKLADTNNLPYYLDSAFKRVLNKALHYHFDNRFHNTSLFLKAVHQLLRSCPEYIEDADKLSIKHENGTEYQIYKNAKREIVLEKKISNKEWRKDNSHKGTIESALNIARLN